MTESCNSHLMQTAPSRVQWRFKRKPASFLPSSFDSSPVSIPVLSLVYSPAVCWLFIAVLVSDICIFKTFSLKGLIVLFRFVFLVPILCFWFFSFPGFNLRHCLEYEFNYAFAYAVCLSSYSAMIFDDDVWTVLDKSCLTWLHPASPPLHQTEDSTLCHQRMQLLCVYGVPIQI